MATEAIQAGEAGQSLAERQSWIDRLIRIPERLPGPMLIWLVVLAAAMIVAANLPIWLAGAQPIGAIEPSSIPPAAFAVYAIGLVLYLNRIASSSYRQFLPALGSAADDQAWLTRLTSAPNLPTLGTIAVLEVVITAGYFSDPRSQAQLAQQPAVILLPTLIEWWVAVAMLGVLIVHTLRQLRAVSDLHAAAASVDLFEPGPLVAFSRLTAAAAIGIIVIAIPFTFPLELTFGLISGIAFILLAGATFVVPLNGLHGRLVAEQGRLMHAVNQRLKATTARIHQAVDTGELDQATRLRDALTSLVAERELIIKLPTWPWSTTVFRGIASALLVPVVIFIITQLIARYL